MLTVGVDLAAEPAGTALAVIAWDDEGALITKLLCGAGDDDILAALAGADKAGIDCPLGWPDAFISFLTDHQARPGRHSGRHDRTAVAQAAGMAAD